MDVSRTVSVFAAWCLTAGAIAAAPEYRVTDLGTLGGDTSVANDVAICQDADICLRELMHWVATKQQ